MSFPRRDVARQSGSVNVLVASTPVAADNPSRVEITFVNDGANAVYLAFASQPGVMPAAQLNKGVRLNPNGGSYTTTSYNGPVAAIAAVGASNLTVTEF